MYTLTWVCIGTYKVCIGIGMYRHESALGGKYRYTWVYMGVNMGISGYIWGYIWVYMGIFGGKYGYIWG